MSGLKTLLDHAQPIPGFVHEQIEFLKVGETGRVDVSIRAHEQIRPRCSKCLKPCPGYDRLPSRSWLQVPFWDLLCMFHHAPRRVHCPVDGIGVEKLPWCEGKRPLTLGMTAFLAMWAKRLSWLETARAFKVGREAVSRPVGWTVAWGLEHRVLSGVDPLGIDEIYRGRGRFLTIIYPVDEGMRRLLWSGPERTEATLRAGLDQLGPEVVSGVKFVCTDMWRPYLNVVRMRLAQALHVLDRFHITAHLNGAVDEAAAGSCRDRRRRAKPAPQNRRRCAGIS